ncbi:DUF5753 domain-containing protein [Streptomyces otsuchiensis]|uniref:DUF5753 domain-containing protein n=1 Tax=Streptomyces otsuchiensis TaxID=2681388 RepID=UPI001030D5C4|nr:DUF5753 domain-containing protein [Streptomyces otsuchiensis]
MVNRKDLNPDASPEAAYGARLRRLREARGWLQNDLGARMGYSGRHVSGVETGNKSPTRKFSAALDVALGLDGTAESFAREWGEIRHGVLLQGFPEYVDLEGRATEVRLFDTVAVPGPLQTREYAEVHNRAAVDRGSITPEQADERVQAVIRRQAALTRKASPMVIAVLDETAIRRPFGGPDVMHAQLQRLVDFAALPNTILQLAPLSLGERRPLDRLVNLLTLPGGSVVSYVESQTHGHLERESSSVLPLVRAYHQLQAESLSQAASVAMIEEVRKGTP